jgi:hypothetical protein
LIYGWFAVEHGRRRILHFDTTDQPTAAWVVQQLREAFGFAPAPRHLIFDRDAIFSREVVLCAKSFGAKPTRTGYRTFDYCYVSTLPIITMTARTSG